jgi:hypothetical protein
MGKPQDIGDLQKTDAAFKTWFESQQQSINASRDKAVKDNSARAAAFIKAGGWTDAKPFSFGAYGNVDHAKSWSLDGINAIIDDTVNKLLSGQDPPKTDTSTGGIKGAVSNPIPSASMALIAGLAGPIALGIKGLVQSVLSGVTSSLNASTGDGYGSLEPAPGPLVFNACIESSYASRDFFNNETILQNVIVFESWFIASRLKDLATFSKAQAYLDTVAACDIQIDKIDGYIAALDPGADNYTDQLTKYQTCLDAVTKVRDSAKLEAAAAK